MKEIPTPGQLHNAECSFRIGVQLIEQSAPRIVDLHVNGLSETMALSALASCLIAHLRDVGNLSAK